MAPEEWRTVAYCSMAGKRACVGLSGVPAVCYPRVRCRRVRPKSKNDTAASPRLSSSTAVVYAFQR
jgi:hypothetical protein